MRIRKIISLLCILCYLCLLFGCTPVKEVRSADVVIETDKKPVIAVSLASDTSTYLVEVSKHLQKTANELGAELILKWADWDVELQTKQLGEFIDQQVDAIILCPVNSKSMLVPLKEIKEADIPVINLNIRVDAISSEYIDTYVGASSSEEASLAAKIYIDRLGATGGEIAIIEGAIGSEPQIFRTQTFMEELASHPEIEVVTISNGDWNRGKAALVAKDLLEKYPELDGIYCHDSNMAMGVVMALQEMGTDQELVIVGISENEEYLQAVQEGWLAGIITQPPYYEGSMAVYCALNAMEGEVLRPWYKDPIEVVTIENVHKFDI